MLDDTAAHVQSSRDNRIVVLVSGASATGKTTLRRLVRRHLASRLGQIAALDLDDVYNFVESDFSTPPINEREVLWGLARRSAAAIAAYYLREGMGAVFVFGNTLFRQEQAEEFAAALAATEPPLHLLFHFTLALSAEESRRRMVNREGSLPDWYEAHLAERTPRGEDEWTSTLSDSTLTPEQTLDLLASRIERGVGVIP